MIIAFSGQKGGVGKSTLSIATAQELKRRGRDVVILDTDSQSTALIWSKGAEEGVPTVPVFVVNDELVKGARAAAEKYDIVIIDVPGRLDSVQKRAMLAANLAIFPLGPSDAELWAVQTNIQLVKEARDFNENLDSVYLLNRMRKSSAETVEIRKLLEKNGQKTFESTIGDRVDFKRFLAYGAGIHEYAPTGKSSMEIKRFVTELERYLALGVE